MKKVESQCSTQSVSAVNVPLHKCSPPVSTLLYFPVEWVLQSIVNSARASLSVVYFVSEP